MNSQHNKKSYKDICPSGGDTGATLNLHKRLSILTKYITLPNARVLDAGCGSGQYLVSLLGLGVDAWGVEYFDNKVNIFRKANPEYASRILCGDISVLPFPDNNFDVVLLNEVLEHVPNIEASLAEINRVLKQDGVLVVFSPNRFYPFETHEVRLKLLGIKIPHAFPGIPYLPLFIGTKLFDYEARNFWPHQLINLLNCNSFTVIDTNFIVQTFENISGHQPKLVKCVTPILRKLFSLMELIPFVRAIFSVSQICVAKRFNDIVGQ
ncbi:hypothetical protein GURASL_23640 [Geotalea uraniireducens]|uniref:Methyltransferase type 11 domain-containing protein n=1 Tax=Geotalea uraniireducens TaxID=351604 RepID=A0ABM8ELL0_9BACT|nr:class I SAM-dependent methyltransferase [Geotalea uraniireducens]BDV43441.1 hypothetical protein GURASL_23640 [Geotalea uraniireducens]